MSYLERGDCAKCPADRALVRAGGAGKVSNAETSTLLEHVADAIDRLSDAQRAALTLHDFEGLRMREVARRLRIPLKTAFSRSYAARKAIADELRRLGYALPAWWPLWPGYLQRLLPKLGGVRRPLVLAHPHTLWIALGMCVFMQSPVQPKPAALPPMATPRTVVARAAPSRAIPAPSPPSAAAPRPSRRRAPLRRVLDTPAVAEVAAPDNTPPGFRIIHMSAEDPAPAREHPFAARLRESTPHVTSMAARLAPRTLEPALLATTLGAE